MSPSEWNKRVNYMSLLLYKKYPGMIINLLHGIHIENKLYKYEITYHTRKNTNRLRNSVTVKKVKKDKHNINKKNYDDTRSACECV